MDLDLDLVIWILDLDLDLDLVIWILVIWILKTPRPASLRRRSGGAASPRRQAYNYVWFFAVKWSPKNRLKHNKNNQICSKRNKWGREGSLSFWWHRGRLLTSGVSSHQNFGDFKMYWWRRVTLRNFDVSKILEKFDAFGDIKLLVTSNLWWAIPSLWARLTIFGIFWVFFTFAAVFSTVLRAKFWKRRKHKILRAEKIGGSRNDWNITNAQHFLFTKFVLNKILWRWRDTKISKMGTSNHQNFVTKILKTAGKRAKKKQIKWVVSRAHKLGIAHQNFDVTKSLMSPKFWWHQTFGDIKILVTSKFWCHQNFDVTKILMSPKFWCHQTFGDIKILVGDPEFVSSTHNSFDLFFLGPLSCGFKNFCYKILVIWSSHFGDFGISSASQYFVQNKFCKKKMLRVRDVSIISRATNFLRPQNFVFSPFSKFCTQNGGKHSSESEEDPENGDRGSNEWWVELMDSGSAHLVIWMSGKVWIWIWILVIWNFWWFGNFENTSPREFAPPIRRRGFAAPPSVQLCDGFLQ